MHECMTYQRYQDAHEYAHDLLHVNVNANRDHVSALTVCRSAV